MDCLLADIVVSAVYGYCIFGNISRYIYTRRSIDEDNVESRENIVYQFIKKTHKWRPLVQIENIVFGGGVETRDTPIMTAFQGSVRKERSRRVFNVDNLITNNLLFGIVAISVYREIEGYNHRHNLGLHPPANISFPIDLRRAYVPVLYSNSHYAAVDRKAVVRMTHIKNRLPLSFTLFTLASVYVGFEWAISSSVPLDNRRPV